MQNMFVYNIYSAQTMRRGKTYLKVRISDENQAPQVSFVLRKHRGKNDVRVPAERTPSLYRMILSLLSFECIIL